MKHFLAMEIPHLSNKKTHLMYIGAHSRYSCIYQNVAFNLGRFGGQFLDHTYTVNGSEIRIKTSWGNGIWNPIMYRVLGYIPGGFLGFLPPVSVGKGSSFLWISRAQQFFRFGSLVPNGRLKLFNTTWHARIAAKTEKRGQRNVKQNISTMSGCCTRMECQNENFSFIFSI